MNHIAHFMAPLAHVTAMDAVNLAQLDDTELMGRVGEGDTVAFAFFYDRFARRVYAGVLRVLRDPSMSQEVTQEVLVEAWVQASRFEGSRGSLDGWILTMARRRAIDRVRSEQAARDRNIRATAISGARPEDEVAGLAVLSDEHQQVRDALDNLSVVQREAIVMAYFGDQTYREVAELLEVPLSTVKTRIRDGLIRLRAELDAHDFEPV